MSWMVASQMGRNCVWSTMLSNISSGFVHGLVLLLQPQHEADDQSHQDRDHHQTDEAYALPSASAGNIFVIPHFP